MIITSNVHIFTCVLILFTQWPFSNKINSNKQSSILAEAALFQRSGGDAQKTKDEQQQQQQDLYNNERLVAKLNNNEIIPLIGLGAENLENDHIANIVSAAFSSSSSASNKEEEERSNLGYHLLDTARVSGNERLISEVLSNVVSKNHEDNPAYNTTIHIVTKVWYTHLGYERTKISIQESMDDILGQFKDKPYVTVKIHFLIHWPQCYDAIEWMNCVEDEEALPAYVKETGDAIPHQAPFAYLGSWRAMEEMYKEHYPTISSIGVSNFEREQLDALLQAARIKPHVYQGNLEMVMLAMPELRHYNIHPQVYGLFQTVTTTLPVTKIDIARRQLISLADEISREINLTEKDENSIFPATLLLSFLLQNEVGVMARTTSVQNLMYNSPKKILQVPSSLAPAQNDRLLHILDSVQYHWNEEEEGHKVVEADEKVHVNFHNKLSEDQSPINIAFLGVGAEEQKEANMVTEKMEPGSTLYIESYPGHVFLVTNAETGDEIKKFEVKADYGKAEWFSIEL